MNLILLFPGDMITPDTARLTGRRLQHVREVLQPDPGQRLTVGMADVADAPGETRGLFGTGEVLSAGGDEVLLRVVFSGLPPAKLPVTLAVALPRPPVLRRVLLTAASLGVPSIVLFQSARVEKSYWQSSALTPDSIQEQLVLGLEQARDTVLPAVTFQRRFRPFVEDILPGLLSFSAEPGVNGGIVADPAGALLPAGDQRAGHQPGVIVIGPEGGFISYERDKFVQAGCRLVSLGPRVLRVETALVTLLAKSY